MAAVQFLQILPVLIVILIVIPKRSNGQGEFENPDSYIYDDSVTPTLPPPYYTNGGIPDDEYYYPEEDLCKQRESCKRMKHRFVKNMLKNCYCDDQCQLYNDCCDDFQPSDPSKIYESLPQSTFSCRFVKGLTSNEGTHRQEPVYVVEKCPKNYKDKYFKDRCEQEKINDTFTKIPVNGRTSVIFYKNYFCAVCHGVTDISFASVTIDCGMGIFEMDDEEQGFNVSSIETLLSDYNNHCSLKFSNYTVRYCKGNVISQCLNHWKDKRVEKKCKSSTKYRYGPQKIFKNEFCAQCNNVNVIYLYCTFETTQPDNIAGIMASVNSLSILLNLNTGRGTVSHKKSRKGQITEDIMSTLELRRCMGNQMYDPFAKICRHVSCRLGYRFLNGECVDDIGGFDEVEGYPFSTKLPSEKATGMATSSGFNYGTQTGTSTTNGKRLNNGIENFECPLVTLKESDYQVMSSGAIYVPLYAKQYNKGDFANKSNGDVFICAPFTDQNYTVSIPTNISSETVTMFQYDRIQGLISYIGLLISIICLIVVFVIYMMFPSLRNTPGKCVVSLVVALLLAQLSFLLGGPLGTYPAVCISLGVLTHYFYLGSFFWMNILSTSIYHSVSSSNIRENRTIHFVYASFFAWSATGLIVGVALILEFLEDVPKMFKPMYGDGVCWITQKWPLLIFFAGPVALLLLINIILFIGTTIKICTISQATRYSRSNKSQTHQFLLCVKLCLIMGLTWIFGFIAAITDLTVLWYVFIVFNSLHGAYICFAFVCTRNVYGLLSGKGKKNKNRVTGGYNNTNSTSSGPSWAHTKHSVLDTSFNGNDKVIELRETSI